MGLIPEPPESIATTREGLAPLPMTVDERLSDNAGLPPFEGSTTQGQGNRVKGRIGCWPPAAP